MNKIAVIGLGYVGLPLALLAGKKDYEVVGIDADKNKIDLLLRKKSPIDDNKIQAELKDCKVKFSTDTSLIGTVDIAIVCVPTPVDGEKLPDLTPLRKATESVAKNIRPGKLIIIESTVNPGVCDDVLIPLIESAGKLKVGRDIFVAHCPERINPGDTKWDVSNINRVVGADSPKGLRSAKKIYESIIDGQVRPMGSLKEAEAVKVVENSFRDINIAFVNELAMSFQKMGINIENVIDGAATKPFAFMPHHPGCGVGGHCIPVDPYYLIEHARGFGFDHRILMLAREINESMPAYTIELMEGHLKQKNISTHDAKILVLGQAYKPNVDDSRESPAIRIYSALSSTGYNVKSYDPFIEDKSDFNSLREALSFANVVILATGHDEFKKIDAQTFADNGVKVVVDGRNIFKDIADDFSKHNIAFSGIGVIGK